MHRYLILLLVSTVLAKNYDPFTFGSDANLEDHPHRVFQLPDAPAEPKFPLYSGYIDVDIEDIRLPESRRKKERHNMFYALSEAIRVDPLEAPLIVWLNGGPGASSLAGLLRGIGPYIIDRKTGNMSYSELSWNQYANVLLIESPSRVGFSRYENPSFSQYDDDITAHLNMNVLQKFMTSVHPRYSNRSFFITGPSYAGAYVPFFARAVLTGIRDGNFTNENFQGIAMSNPFMDNNSFMISKVMQMFALGMIRQSYGPTIFEQWNQVQRGEEIDFDEDLYDVYLQWYERISPRPTNYNLAAMCVGGWDNQDWHIAKPVADSECYPNDRMEQYMNTLRVQQSLHVTRGDGNATVNWAPVQYDFLQGNYTECEDTIPLYSEIFAMAKSDFRLLFFSGDLDLVCPALHVAHGTARIAKENGMEEIHDSSTTWNYLGDLGGAQTRYRLPNSSITMDVLTVRGAGHRVTTNKPSRAFQLINNFIFSKDSPIDYSKKIQRRK